MPILRGPDLRRFMNVRRSRGSRCSYAKRSPADSSAPGLIRPHPQHFTTTDFLLTLNFQLC